jgi:hypothetical protein
LLKELAKPQHECATVPLDTISRRTAGLRARLLTLAALLGGCAPALSDPGSPSSSPDGPMEGGSAGDGGATNDHDGPSPDLLEVADATDGAGKAEASTGLSTADLVGRWSGTTSQGDAISFTISAGLDGWELGWQLPACGSTTTASFPPVPVVDGTVTRSMPAGPGGVSVTLTISFSSPTTATGSIAFTVNPAPAGGCSGSATATFTAQLVG